MQMENEKLHYEQMQKNLKVKIEELDTKIIEI